MAAVDPHSVPTQTFDWGAIKWLVAPDRTPLAKLTFGEVVLLPGRGHDRHNHPTAEEILYVLSGKGLQMVSDGWQTMRLLALYNPAGAEAALETLPDFREMAAEAGHPHSLDSLAAKALMSRSVFVKKFTAHFGRTPAAFLREVRLRRRAHLLRTTGLSVDAVASRVGFNSRSHLSHAFAEYFGQSPAQLRQVRGEAPEGDGRPSAVS